MWLLGHLMPARSPKSPACQNSFICSLIFLKVLSVAMVDKLLTLLDDMQEDEQ